jgi:hypothetical protein
MASRFGVNIGGSPDGPKSWISTGWEQPIEDGVMRHVRVGIPMGIRPNDPALFAALQNGGSSIIGILGVSGLRPAWGLQEWTESVANRLKLFPYIHTWEIMNEPYTAQGGLGLLGNPPIPHNYLQMLKSAYVTIKSLRPNDEVIGLGGVPANTDKGSAFDIFYRLLFSLGITQYCDAISIHAYSGFYYLLDEPIYSMNKITWHSVWEKAWQTLTSLIGDKPIYVDETGLVGTAFPGTRNYPPTIASPSEQRQDQFMRESFEFWRSKPNVVEVDWWNLFESGTSDVGQGDYGIYTIDRAYQNAVPKLAMKTLAAYEKF